MLTMRQFNRFFIGWWVRHGLRARDRIGYWNSEHWDAVLDQSKLESDGISCVRIRFSEPEELPRLIRRMVHQAYRNGAKEVFVTVPDGYEVSETESYGYYRLRRLDDGSYGTEYTGRTL